MDTLTCHRQNTDDAEECLVLVADTPELLEEVFRLRYQVYCVEKGFEPGCNGKEFDEFDSRAHHVLLIHRASSEPIGTVRVVPPSPTEGLQSLPMASVSSRALMRHLPPQTTGEISRFAVSKRQRMNCRAGSMVRLGLMQGIVRLSDQLGLTDWCAIMDPLLLRLLQTNAIYFSAMGPLVEHHGMRQPSCGNIGNVLDRIRSEQPGFWNYVTLGGTLGRQPAPAARLAA